MSTGGLCPTRNATDIYTCSGEGVGAKRFVIEIVNLDDGVGRPPPPPVAAEAEAVH
jgi:hypothetical protein